MALNMDVSDVNLAIDELRKILDNQEHSKNDVVANEIIEFLKQLKIKFDNK